MPIVCPGMKLQKAMVQEGNPTVPNPHFASDCSARAARTAARTLTCVQLCQRSTPAPEDGAGFEARQLLSLMSACAQSGAEHIAVEDICRHFSLPLHPQGRWLATPGLHVALSPNRDSIAIGWRNEVSVFSTRHSAVLNSSPPPSTNHIPPALAYQPPPTHQRLSSSGRQRGGQQAHEPLPAPETLLGSATVGEHDITSITWAQLSDRSGLAPASSQTARQADHDAGAARFWDTATSANEQARTASDHALDKDTSVFALLLSDSGGFLQLHTSTGRAILRQRLHTGALKHVSWSVDRDGEGSLVVTGTGCVFLVSASQLRSALLAGQAALLHRHDKPTGGLMARLSWSGGVHTDPIGPLHCQRWDLPRGLQHMSLATFTDPRTPSLYAVLRDAVPHADNKVVIMGGSSPCLASVELRPAGTRSALGAAIGAATSVASEVFSLARAAGGTVVGGPAAITRGIKAFVMAPLFSTPIPAGAAAAAPLAVYPDLSASAVAPQAAPATVAALADPPRTPVSIVPAPRGSYVAVCDSLGRVLLLDGNRLTVIRMWKGYRDAQCGWLDVPVDTLTQVQLTRTLSTQRTAITETLRAATSTTLHAAASDASSQPYVSFEQTATDSTAVPRDPASASSRPASQSQQQQGSETAHRLQQLSTAPFDPGGVWDGDDDTGDRCLVLAIHAPKRQVVELWPVPHGQCVANVAGGPQSRIVQCAGCEVGVGGVGVRGPRTRSYCCLLDAATGKLQVLSL